MRDFTYSPRLSEPLVRTVTAVQHVRALRGETGSHLMRCDDGNMYAVKFKDNPRHSRILANELMGTLLAGLLGLPYSTPAIVEIDPRIADDVQAPLSKERGEPSLCRAGLQFGSRFLRPLRGLAYDYLPISELNRISNRRAFVGMLAMDKWLGNTDRRQIVLGRFFEEAAYSIVPIDFARCFNAGGWNFLDGCEHGSYTNHAVYAQVTDWSTFEPWLSRIENMPSTNIWHIADQIPREWYASDREGLASLVAALGARRSMVRALIASFGASDSSPFPNWESEGVFSLRNHPNRYII